jgi:dihydrofolate reductase
MADLIYTSIASLDGYVTDEDGNFDWAHPSDELHAFVNDLQRSVGTFLCGRRTYQTMRVWDTRSLDDLSAIQREFAELWRATDKVIYSSTLDSVPEPRTRLEHTLDLEVVRAMKAASEHDLSIGGPGLAANAIREGLVDRYVLMLVPTIVGGGTRALPDDVNVSLALDATRRFENGTVLLDYRLR